MLKARVRSWTMLSEASAVVVFGDRASETGKFRTADSSGMRTITCWERTTAARRDSLERRRAEVGEVEGGEEGTTKMARGWETYVGGQGRHRAMMISLAFFCR